MTRKDYEVLSTWIAGTQAALLAERDTPHPDLTLVFDTRVADLCHTLRADNPRFDAIRFRRACGVL